MVREGVSKAGCKLRLIHRNQVDFRKKSIFGSGDSKCKGPEAVFERERRPM